MTDYELQEIESAAVKGAASHMTTEKSVHDGNWQRVPDRICDGKLKVWDQALVCPVCEMNTWYLPEAEHEWPSWYTAKEYGDCLDLFFRLHPSPCEDD